MVGTESLPAPTVASFFFVALQRAEIPVGFFEAKGRRRTVPVNRQRQSILSGHQRQQALGVVPVVRQWVAVVAPKRKRPEGRV